MQTVGIFVLLLLCGECVGWPPSFELLGAVKGFGMTVGVAVKDRVAYVVGAGPSKTSYGLTAWNVTDPKGPTLLGGFDTEAQDTGVTLNGNFLYVAFLRRPGGAVCCNALQVMDISNPAEMRNASYVYFGPGLVNETVGGRGRDMAVLRGVLYLGAEGGLHRVEVSDPRQPKDLGLVQVDPSSGGTDVANVVSDGKYLYVRVLGTTYVVDVLADLTLRVLGKFPTSFYAVDSTAGVLVTSGVNFDFWDITRLPASLPKLGSVPVGTPLVERVAAANNVLYVTSSGTLTCVDYTRPTTPVAWSGNFTLPATVVEEIVVVDDLLYMPDWSGFLMVKVSL